MNDIKLGLIGMSQGNGHPYSWSAIFNGYDRRKMAQCGFPVISEYLSAQSFPADTISNASVTHVWTQDRSLTNNIAEASYIPNIVEKFEDMIEHVDAVLLARDDADKHLLYAIPFLEAGIPIYVDKPLALSCAAAQDMIRAQKYPGQLFSCSALRYAESLSLSSSELNSLGSIRATAATVPNNWNKYAVHGIEPLLKFIPKRGSIQKSASWNCHDRRTLHVEFTGGVEIEIKSMGSLSVPISLDIYGSSGDLRLEFRDTFNAFRSCLQDFVDGVRARDIRISPCEMLEVVELIELGRQ